MSGKKSKSRPGLLPELEDQPWFPAWMRNAQTNFIGTAVYILGTYRWLIPKLKDWLHEKNAHTVLDLCSGSGWPAALLADARTVILSDLYPNLPAFEHRQQHAHARYLSIPLPFPGRAEHYPNLCITVFNAWHHFTDEQRLEFIRLRQQRRESFVVAEPLAGTPLDYLRVLVLSIPGCWLFMPFVRPVDGRSLLFTYLIPLIPFLVLWDGWVSVYRSRTNWQKWKSSSEACGFEADLWQHRSLLGHTTVLLAHPQP